MSNFKALECKCGCGMGQHIKHWNPDIIRLYFRLEELKICVVSSGFRCPRHNAQVGGVPNSYHTFGSAIDIVPLSPVTLDQLKELVGQVLRQKFNRFGMGINLREKYIHIDTGEFHEAGRRWVIQ